MNMSWSRITAIVAMMMLAAAMWCQADEAAAPTNQVLSEATLAATTSPDTDTSDKWTFNSPLYVWLAGVNGDLTIRGQSAHLDLSPTDVLNHLDVSFMGYFELAKPQFGFYAQPNYMKLSADGSAGPHIKANDDLQLWIVEFGGFYRIWQSSSDRPAELYAVAGGRYWNVHNELTLKSPLGNTSGAGTTWLMDPIVGLRFQEYFTKRLHVRVQGDVGGFGISDDTSRFSWQLLPTVGYDFTMPVIKKPSTVFVGWRQINVQHLSGSGASKKSFDLNLEGALIGLNVQLF
jgi:hypothetical protein